MLPNQRAVRINGSQKTVGARAFDVLSVLVKHAGQVVTKSDLLDQVWADLMVEESNLTVQIASLRKLLGAGAISTVPGIGYQFTLPLEVKAQVEKTKNAGQGANLPLPSKPSLVVLPFADLTGDPEKEYLVDGIVVDLIAALSRIHAFFVISSSSSFMLKGQETDLRKISEQLGVRYVLEGSIQRSKDQLRINTQLVEAASSVTIWSNTFSGSYRDIFELHDRLVEEVASALEPNIILAESERARGKPTTDLMAYDLWIQAGPEIFRVLSQNNFLINRDRLQQAIKLDPNHTYAQALLVNLHLMAYASRWISYEEARSILLIAEAILEKLNSDAVEMKFAAHALAYLDKQQHRGATVLKRAYALNPNSPLVMVSSGWVHNYIGETKIAIDHFNRSLRINPLDPNIGLVRSGLSTAYLIEGRFEKAVEAGEQANAEAPDFATTLIQLALSYWKLDQKDKAAKYCSQLLKKVPWMTVSGFYEQTPFLIEPYREEIREAFLAMGVPE